MKSSLSPLIFSFNKDNNKCYLKTVDIEPTNVEHTTEYQSTMKGCTNSKCVQEV